MELIIFFLLYHFAAKKKNVDTHWNDFGKAVPMSTYRIYFTAKITTKIDLITAHAPIKAQSSNLVVFQPVYFYVLLYKNICCRYSFKLLRQVEAIQMSTNNICFYEENQKNIA